MVFNVLLHSVNKWRKRERLLCVPCYGSDLEMVNIIPTHVPLATLHYMATSRLHFSTSIVFICVTEKERKCIWWQASQTLPSPVLITKDSFRPPTIHRKHLSFLKGEDPRSPPVTASSSKSKSLGDVQTSKSGLKRFLELMNYLTHSISSGDTYVQENHILKSCLEKKKKPRKEQNQWEMCSYHHSTEILTRIMKGLHLE